jgi:hypothetical protein
LFKVIATSIDEYFAFDPKRERDLRHVDRAIRRSAPSLKRWFVSGSPDGQPGMKMSMIGYGRFTYCVQAWPRPIPWPILGLALQKNYMSLYCSAKTKASQTPFTLAYADRLGSASLSKRGVVNFEAAGDFDGGALSEMLRALEAGLEQGDLAVGYRRLTGTRSGS